MRLTVVLIFRMATSYLRIFLWLTCYTAFVSSIDEGRHSVDEGSTPAVPNIVLLAIYVTLNLRFLSMRAVDEGTHILLAIVY